MYLKPYSVTTGQAFLGPERGDKSDLLLSGLQFAS